MGYEFTPVKSGQITKLGGFFNGTKTVRLFAKATGQQLAEATVTASNTWGYTTLGTPVSVTAGTRYLVLVYVAGSGGSYRALNPPGPLPKTLGDLTVETSAYFDTTSNPNATPATPGVTVYTNPYTMYGQADVEFVPNP